ncbi:MAG: hypothetical protein ACI3W6_07245 [Clostridia bacterium]
MNLTDLILPLYRPLDLLIKIPEHRQIKLLTFDFFINGVNRFSVIRFLRFQVRTGQLFDVFRFRVQTVPRLNRYHTFHQIDALKQRQPFV